MAQRGAWYGVCIKVDSIQSIDPASAWTEYPYALVYLWIPYLRPAINVLFHSMKCVIPFPSLPRSLVVVEMGSTQRLKRLRPSNCALPVESLPSSLPPGPSLHSWDILMNSSIKRRWPGWHRGSGFTFKS
jgi:hypothetical protein